MSTAARNIVVRVVRNRMAAGEKFENIINSYPRLTKEDIKEIEEALQIYEQENIESEGGQNAGILQ